MSQSINFPSFKELAEHMNALLETIRNDIGPSPSERFKEIRSDIGHSHSENFKEFGIGKQNADVNKNVTEHPTPTHR